MRSSDEVFEELKQAQQTSNYVRRVELARELSAALLLEYPDKK